MNELENLNVGDRVMFNSLSMPWRWHSELQALKIPVVGEIFEKHQSILGHGLLFTVYAHIPNISIQQIERLDNYNPGSFFRRFIPRTVNGTPYISDMGEPQRHTWEYHIRYVIPFIPVSLPEIFDYDALLPEEIIRGI